MDFSIELLLLALAPLFVGCVAAEAWYWQRRGRTDIYSWRDTLCNAGLALLHQGADKLAWFDSVERHNAGRSAANFRENRHYPRAILLRWEPMYAAAGWGPGVCAERYRRESATALSGDEHRHHITCRVFPELARCQRAVRLAAAPRTTAAASRTQAQA